MGLFGGNKAAGLTKDAVLTALRGVVDPNVGKDIVTLGLVHALTVEAGQVSFTLQFTGEQPPLARAEIHSRARKAVQALPGVTEVKAGIASRAAGGHGGGHGHGPARPAAADARGADPGGQAHDRGLVREGRRRQVHRGRQPGAGAPRRGRRGRHRGRGRLRAQHPADDRRARPPGDGREPHRAGAGVRREGDVDRVLREGRGPGDLARAR